MWIYIVVVWRGNMYLHNFQLRKQISNKLIILKLFGYYRIDQLLWNCSAVAEYPGYCGIRRLLQSWLTILELFGCCWIGRLLWNWSAFVKFFGYCLIGRLLFNWSAIVTIYCFHTCSRCTKLCFVNEDLTTNDEIAWNRIFVTL